MHFRPSQASENSLLVCDETKHGSLKCILRPPQNSENSFLFVIKPKYGSALKKIHNQPSEKILMTCDISIRLS
jgi:hypothetical protein